MPKTVVFFLLFGIFCSQPSLALDYDPSAFWRFTDPLGEQPDLRGFYRRLGDELLYHTTTGELVYHSVSKNNWFPPDILSRSGAFLTEAELPSVLLHDSPIVPFWADEPSSFWEVEAKIDFRVIPGSEALRVNYDPYKFWPYQIVDKEVLGAWGLVSLPSYHSYGRVLPSGLTQGFLENDLISTTLSKLRVVPEPNSLMIATVVFSLSLPSGMRKKTGCL